MGTRPGQSSMVHPAPSAISLAWPIRPKPVTSVQALGRRGTAARAASRLSAAIRSVIARYSAPLSSSALAAVVRIPVPRGLVSTSRSPSLAPRLVQYRSGVDQAADAQAVLGLRVLDAVAACGHCASLRHLGRAPLQDGPHRLPRQAGGDGQQIHGQPGLAPHGVHVGEGIGRRDLPKVIGVVHHRWEEIHRLDQRQLIREAVHRSVIAGVIAHQQVGLKRPGQPGQNLLQDTRSQLGPSPTGRGHGGQAQLLIRHRLTPSRFL